MNRRARARALGCALALACAAASLGTPASATEAGGAARATVDRVAVRYYAPETGGSARPHFVSERMLAFEARLDALAEQAPDSAAYEDRFVRAALDRHVAEDMLSALAVQSGTTPADLTALAEEEHKGLLERVGADSLHAAMTAEGVDEAEVDSLLRRRVRAAWYIDRALTPLLRPTDEQLREVFRTSAHPFKNRPFEEVRAALARWFVEERLRAAEMTYLQVARARVKIVVVARESGGTALPNPTPPAPRPASEAGGT